MPKPAKSGRKVANRLPKSDLLVGAATVVIVFGLGWVLTSTMSFSMQCKTGHGGTSPCVSLVQPAPPNN